MTKIQLVIGCILYENLFTIRQNFDRSNSKELADDKLILAQVQRFIFYRVKNIF